MRQKWRIGGDDDDDRTFFGAWRAFDKGRLHQFGADALSPYREIAALAEIRLHEDPDRLASLRDELRRLGVPLR